jgi:peptidoglycan hydrolase CwlO-like protein
MTDDVIKHLFDEHAPLVATFVAAAGASVGAILTWFINYRKSNTDQAQQLTVTFTCTIEAFQKLIGEQRLLLEDARRELQVSKLANSQLLEKVMDLQTKMTSSQARIGELEKENVKLKLENDLLRAEITQLKQEMRELRAMRVSKPRTSAKEG